MSPTKGAHTHELDPMQSHLPEAHLPDHFDAQWETVRNDVSAARVRLSTASMIAQAMS